MSIDLWLLRDEIPGGTVLRAAEWSEAVKGKLAPTIAVFFFKRKP